jgi:hypothetical protein
MWIWIRKTAFYLCKFADLPKEICRLIIIILRICNLQTDIPQKFVDLRLRNEPKSGDLRPYKFFACPPLTTV